ncbi:hypothetical protein B0H16DRAFT_1448109 [Mycena metata]|uniref:Uncharacterized protein n=1 Tax=Mycena metata TaxID=1033252 RepID=A0AAD7K9C7_9AGAR|nr:hypothetical protein B0H16DRAFT_1448109 [Mycena metata]
MDSNSPIPLDSDDNTKWVPGEWIRQGRKYENILPHVVAARHCILQLPASVQSHFPRKNLPISQLLLFNLPPVSRDETLLDSKYTYSTVEPTQDIEDFPASLAGKFSLEAKFGQNLDRATARCRIRTSFQGQSASKIRTILFREAKSVSDLASINKGPVLSEISLPADANSRLNLVALRGFTEMDVHYCKAECMIRLGDTFNKRGDFLKALELWEQARPLFERFSQVKQVQHIDEKVAGIDEDITEQHQRNLDRFAELNAPTGMVEELDEDLSEDELENEDTRIPSFACNIYVRLLTYHQKVGDRVSLF